MVLVRIFTVLWKGQWRSLILAAFTSVFVLAAGAALLGLSGWFITAAGMAGLAGAGATFDIFRPSAAIRFLALGRAAGRYGERLTSHDATLRGLAELRGRILRSMMRLPLAQASRLRGSERLNHLTVDVDALDGISLRIFLPALSAVAVLAGTFLSVWLLSGLFLALWLMGSFLLGAIMAMALSARLSFRSSRLAQRSVQALRMRFIDMMRGQAELTIFGRLDAQRQAIIAAHHRLQRAQQRVDLSERISGFIMASTTTIAASGALLIGVLATQAGAISPAIAALGFFLSLAMGEVFAPLLRGITELGRMKDAARRLEGQIAEIPAHNETADVALDPDQPVLSMSDVGFAINGRIVFSGLSIEVAAGETVGLIGPSGSGKTTLLMLACGQLAAASGEICLGGQPLAAVSESRIFDAASLLPQRSALVRGSIRESLQLGRPDLSEAEAWRVLGAVQLDRVVQGKGGLDFHLGEGGSGLSGGEQRRLALARVLLRMPRLLLLDEPTEGLDEQIAGEILAGIRNWLPEAAILMASHRPIEQNWADRLINLTYGGETVIVP